MRTLWSSQQWRQQCVSAKLRLAARGRTVQMLLTHSLPWGPVAHVITKFNSHRIFFLLLELQDVIFSRRATINIYKGQ